MDSSDNIGDKYNDEYSEKYLDELSQRTLLGLNKKIKSLSSLDEILKSISHCATQILSAERSTIYIYNPDKKEVWSKIAEDLEIPEIRLPLGVGIAGHVAKTLEIINIKDAYNDDRFFRDYDKMTNFTTETLLSAPLLNISGELIGVIQVLNKKNRTFTDNDVNLIQILSRLAAIAIDQYQLYEINSTLREYTENILESIQHAIVVLENDGRIGLANTAAEILTGKSLRQILGKQTTDILGFIPGIENLIEKAKNSSIVEDKIPVSYSNNKELTHINIKIFKLSDLPGTSVGNVIVIEDISDKIKLEIENKRQENLSLIGKMSSTIIHDLKSPMSSIKGYAYLIKKKIQDEKLHSYIDIIDSEVNRMTAMVQEVLDYVRGVSEPNFEVFNWQYFLNSILFSLENEHQQKEVKFNFKNDYSGPVKADKNKLERVFFNIINNALEAMKNNGEFYLTSAMKDNQLYISLRDTGEGMPKIVQERVFDPFYSKGKKSGVGLGLSIVKKIIEEHNGNIRLTSSEGQGSTFYVELPILTSNEEGLTSG